MQLHEKIFRCRRQMGLSQEELAERVGVTRQAVSKWEQGISVPELESLLALAKTFGVTTDYLLSQEDAPQEEQASRPKQDWLDRLPGVLQKGFRRYGWLLGVYMAVGGGLFAGLGALGKYMAESMFNGMNGITDPFGGGFPMYDNMFDQFQQQANQMAANNPASIMCNAVMIFGFVLMAVGIFLAAWLKRKSQTEG